MFTRKICNFITLYVASEFLIVAKGYKLYKYILKSNKLEFFAVINDSKIARLASFSLLRRLFRAEIRCLYRFNSDVWMCIGRKAIFKLDIKTKKFEKCYVIEKGTRPLNLCQANDGTIYFGEYCYNPDMDEIRIFQSKDNGTTWSVAYTFEKGAINHIHGIFQDPYTDKIWVATGDIDKASILGYTQDGFKTFISKYRGSQQCRVCMPLFTKEKIFFATDSQYEQNYIRCIDRNSGENTIIQPIQGSGIYGVQIGEKMLISTTVEPSEVNKDQYAHVWYSIGGMYWEELASYKKDCLPKTYFQFGSITFPQYESDTGLIVWNGRAVECVDGKTIINEL